MLAADASAYGLGAVLSHRWPIAFVSRTLNSSERNYPQIEKEALALVFGIKKFHQYVYGRTFTLVTDHQPLTTILGPKRGVPPLAAARMQRWALLLSAYTYQIQYPQPLESTIGNDSSITETEEVAPSLNTPDPPTQQPRPRYPTRNRQQPNHLYASLEDC